MTEVVFLLGGFCLFGFFMKWFIPILLAFLLLACGGPSHPTGSYTCMYEREANPPDGGLLQGLGLDALVACPYQALDFMDESTVLIGVMGQQMPATYEVEGELIKIYGDGGMVVLRWESDGALQGVAPVKGRFVPK
jgi:hypothetical protein